MPFRYITTDELPNQLLQFGDAFSDWELMQAADGSFGGRLVRFLRRVRCRISWRYCWGWSPW
jgi:hypothetical protein